MAEKTNRKVYVIDTSVLLHDPTAVLNFENNVVVIPMVVINELDHHKSEGSNGTAAAAREAIRTLNELCDLGTVTGGVPTPGGGFLVVERGHYIPKGENFNFNLKENDNLIIGAALKWEHRKEFCEKNKNDKNLRPFFARFDPIVKVTLVTKDLGLKLKAAGCDIDVEDYRNDRVVEKIDELYSGLASIEVDDNTFSTIGVELCSDKKGGTRTISRTQLESMATLPILLPNQCCIFLNEEGDEILAIYKEVSDINPISHFRHVAKPKKESTGHIQPRNNEQALAYALLMDPEIQIVTLSGIAGSGKTLMALLAGFDQAKESPKQILVYRSTEEIGSHLGFLKGTLVEKFKPWAQPILDILELLHVGKEATKAAEPKKDANQTFEDMLNGNNRAIQIQPINYVQGRSFHNKIVIIDESQNFRKGNIKNVITRVGKGTKIILTGDVEQVTNAYLDATSNGLSHVIQRMKGQNIFGHLILRKSERSYLAELAANLL
jgi:PhoH-like ATPase